MASVQVDLLPVDRGRACDPESNITYMMHIGYSLTRAADFWGIVWVGL